MLHLSIMGGNIDVCRCKTSLHKIGPCNSMYSHSMWAVPLKMHECFTVCVCTLCQIDEAFSSDAWNFPFTNRMFSVT